MGNLIFGLIFMFIAGLLVGLAIDWRPKHRKHKHHFRYRIEYPEAKELAMLELNCTNEEKIKVTVNPVTTTGHPAPIENLNVAVQSGDATIDMIIESSFYLISGNPGDTSFLVSADAQLGEGIEMISDIILLHVAGAKANNLGLAADAPVPK